VKGKDKINGSVEAGNGGISTAVRRQKENCPAIADRSPGRAPVRTLIG